MRTSPQPDERYVAGKCAKCSKDVYESLWLLDDAYNVWMGKCPHCAALNFLGMTGLRGYSSSGMSLVLPTYEEAAANNLPADTPTSGPCGKPADQHGTIAGELQHRLANDKPLFDEPSA
jgi:hypothetical protein